MLDLDNIVDLEHYTPRDNHGIEKILVDFAMIVDVDFGVIKTISQYYHSDYFALPLLEVEDENIWLGLIHDNMTDNPVDCVIDPDLGKDEDFYEMLMSVPEEALLVYSNACMTKLYNFILVCMGTGGIVQTTILCKDEMQADIINNLFPKLDTSENFNIVIKENNEELFDAGPYSSLFLRHAIDMYDFDNLDCKSIFLYECLTNMEAADYYNGRGLVPKKVTCGPLMQFNNIQIIRLYEYDNTYFINENYPYAADNTYSDKVDEFFEESEEQAEEDDPEALEYLQDLEDAGIPLDSEEDIGINLEDDLNFDDKFALPNESIIYAEDIDKFIEESIPVVEEDPDLSYLDNEIYNEEMEEDDYE